MPFFFFFPFFFPSLFLFLSPVFPAIYFCIFFVRLYYKVTKKNQYFLKKSWGWGATNRRRCHPALPSSHSDRGSGEGAPSSLRAKAFERRDPEPRVPFPKIGLSARLGWGGREDPPRLPSLPASRDPAHPIRGTNDAQSQRSAQPGKLRTSWPTAPFQSSAEPSWAASAGVPRGKLRPTSACNRASPRLAQPGEAW